MTIYEVNGNSSGLHHFIVEKKSFDDAKSLKYMTKEILKTM